MVIRHGDLGPWNSIWDGDRLAGFIDWDFAAPGHALDDVARLAWYAVPLRPGEQLGVRRRLDTLCAAYGVDPAEMLSEQTWLRAQRAALATPGGVDGR